MAAPGLTGRNLIQGTTGNPTVTSESGNALTDLIESHYYLSESHYDLSRNHLTLKTTVGDLSSSHYDLSRNHLTLKTTVGDLSSSHYDLSRNHLTLKNTVNDLSSSHYDLSRNHLTLKNTVNDLSSSHYDLSRNHLTLKNTVNDLSSSHYDLSRNHLTLKTTVGDLSSSHYDLSRNHLTLKNTVGDLSSSHYDLSRNHLTLKNTVGDLSSSHYDLSRNHLILKNTLGDLSSSHYDLSRNHLTLKTTLGDLSSSHYDLSRNHLTLKTTLGDLSSSHYDLSRNHLTLKNTVGDLSSSHYDLSRNHLTLKNTLGDLSSSHYDLSRNHLTLKNTVSDLSTNNNIRFNNIDSSLGQVYTKTESNNLYVSKSNIDLSNLSTNIIPSTNNEFIIGDISKNWRNAYIKDISATNIDISNKLNVLGPTQLANTLTVGGNVTFNSSTLYVPSTFTIDPFGHDNNTGILKINGSLEVLGTTTTINSSVVDISDKMIVLASNALNSSQANGAGFEISGANVRFIYNDTLKTFESSTGISISGNVVPAFTNSVVSLGESAKKWDIAYIRELNVTSFTNAINGSNITQGTITTTQIANNTIVDGDISANASIAFSKINASLAITDLDISTNAGILGSKLASGTITTTQIANNTIVNDDISANASIAFSKINASLAITDLDISTNAGILGSKLASGTITTTQIASNTIIDDDISANASIAFSKINASLAITDLDISTNAGILGSKIASGTITTTQIANNTIIDDDISANAAISGSKLADASITSDKINQSNNWTFSQLTSNNAYIRDISTTNISVSGNIIFSVNTLLTTPSGNLTSTNIFSLSGASENIQSKLIELSNNKANLANPTFTGTVILPSTSSIGTITSTNIFSLSGASENIQTKLTDLSNNKANLANPTFTGTVGGLISISGDIIPSLDVNFKLGDVSRNWSNAYIRDISATNISVSGNILPLDTSMSDLGSSLKRWRNIYAHDISINTINGQAYNAAPNLTSVSGDIIPSLDVNFKLGDVSRNWSNAYIRDISTTNISVSGNILPLDTSMSDLGSLSKRWRNIYAHDISINTINGQAYSAGGGGTAINLTSVSGDIIPSTNNQFKLGDISRNWSNAYIRDISVTNISVSGNIILNISGASMRIAADASNFSITTTHRLYQNISGGINDPSWSAVNGYYGLAKNAYPSLNPYSSGELALSSWTRRLQTELNGWVSVCWSPELRLFVATAYNGNNRVMTSTNGINWTPRLAAELNGWVSVCWSPELRLFVAVAENGDKRVMTSLDGITWSPRTAAANHNWRSVCWSRELGIFVAVGVNVNDCVMTSINGIDWTSAVGAEPNIWLSVCWSPELYLFVAVANSGNNRVMISSNGINWSPIQATALNFWRSVCWSGELGLFVAVAETGTNKIMISSNGRNWTAITADDSNWRSVCWCAQLRIFLVIANVGTNRVIISSNGINWKPMPVVENINISWYSVCWSPELGIAVAVAESGANRVMTSSLKARPPTSYNVFDNSFNSIDETGNWTFQNITTNSRIYQNISGGINDPSWTAVNGYYALAKDVYPALNPLSYGETAVSTWTSLAVIINGWARICWSSRCRIFVAVGSGHDSNNRVMTSSNGITWNTVPLLYNTHNWWGLTYSEELNLFVAVADYAPPGNLNKVMTSPDGINWLTKTSNNDNEFSSICWSPQLRIFVTLGNGNSNGRLMTSFDGELWSTRILSNISTTNVWTNVCWSPELRIFVAVGMAGTDRVMTSNDGINWTTQTISNTNSWSSVCWSAKLGIFVAVANTGTLNRVMTSPNGINWTTRTTNNNNWESVCWASELGLFVAIASSGSLNRVMSSPNGINWTPRTTPDNSQWLNICWSPELGIFAAVGGNNYLAAEKGVMISSLKGRPPTSYNVFDSCFNSIDESGNWTFQNIDISVNLNPSTTNTGTIGSSSKIWGNAYIRDISATNLSVSSINGQAYSAATAIDLTSVSGDIIPSINVTFKLGDVSRNWSNAYIRDISATNISISGNILPLDTSMSDLGSSLKRWRNIYANDISINTINGQAYSAGGGGTSSGTDIGNYNMLGAIIPPEGTVDRAGYSVAMNDAGDVIAIGAPKNRGPSNNAPGQVRVYYYNGTTWIQRGLDIDGEGSNDRAGAALAMNSDGTIIAIGAPDNAGNGQYRGHVRVYKWTGSIWQQQGLDIDGELDWDQSSGVDLDWGPSLGLSLNSDGTIVAIGSMINWQGGIGGAGHVRVYKYTTTWTQIGLDIDGQAFYERSGMAVSLNSDGTLVAIGAPYNPNQNIGHGAVRVYKWTGSIWQPRGLTIYGDAYGILGSSVSLNAVGDILACGGPRGGPAGGLCYGEVKVYKWINDISWVKQGQTIYGRYYDQNLGRAVALNSVGNILAIGSSDAYDNNGEVIVYKWNDVSFLWEQYANILSNLLPGETFGRVIALNAEGNRVVVGAQNANAGGGYSMVYQYSSGSASLVSTTITPFVNNAYTLGNNDMKWKYGYFNNIIVDRITIDYIFSSKSVISCYSSLAPSTTNPADLGTPTSWWERARINNIYVRYDFFPESNNNSSIGSSSLKFYYIYTTNLSVTNINGQAYSAAPTLTSVSTNIIPSSDVTFKLGDIGKNWSNAYIRDISATNISISGNILPLDASMSDLGSSLKRWRNIYANDISINTINGQAYSAATTINLTSVSGDIIPYLDVNFKLGDVSRNWSNAYIRDISATNISISGNILSTNNNSQVPVSYNTFSVVSAQNRSLVSYIGTVSNEWIPASAYDISKVVLSNRSFIKIEVKVNYTASPEADQTLSFRVRESFDRGTTFETNPVFSDISLGSSMGVTINNIYNGSYYEDISGVTLSGNIITYRLEFRRDCPVGNTIKTGYGIQQSTGNYISLQELYKPL